MLSGPHTSQLPADLRNHPRPVRWSGLGTSQGTWDRSRSTTGGPDRDGLRGTVGTGGETTALEDREGRSTRTGPTPEPPPVRPWSLSATSRRTGGSTSTGVDPLYWDQPRYGSNPVRWSTSTCGGTRDDTGGTPSSTRSMTHGTPGRGETGRGPPRTWAPCTTGTGSKDKDSFLSGSFFRHRSLLDGSGPGPP